MKTELIGQKDAVRCKFWIFTCVNVVLCLRLAGVGHDAVVGVCPACCGPKAGDNADVPPVAPLLPVPPGSGFNFLNAPSAGQKCKKSLLISRIKYQETHLPSKKICALKCDAPQRFL